MERETDRAAGTSPQTCKFNLRYRSFSKFLGPTAQAFLLDFLASVQSLTACTGAVNSRSQGNAWLIVDTMPRLSSRAPPSSSFAVCMKESPCTDCTNIKAKAFNHDRTTRANWRSTRRLHRWLHEFGLWILLCINNSGLAISELRIIWFGFQNRGVRSAFGTLRHKLS